MTLDVPATHISFYVSCYLMSTHVCGNVGVIITILLVIFFLCRSNCASEGCNSQVDAVETFLGENIDLFIKAVL